MVTDPLVTNNKIYSSLTDRQRLTFQRIYQWRQDLAKRIDEKPEYIIKSADIINCIVHPRNPEEIAVIVGKYSESYQNQSATFLKLVNNYEYYDQLTQNICHNCLIAGHCAWGCLEDYSKENQQRFYAANPASKNVVNRHRRQHRDANRRALKNQQH
ncbi:unnamed protein product [Allacma fusca]|uniref:Uncharacterized protein n=1 Tax=Allacma fusca TaxID=39272 RepID=A0A8J2P7S8_9HEXA|nr:unnamed protein product [Allacma fusca]